MDKSLCSPAPLLNLTARDMRFLFLSAGLILYALVGSPTPDKFSWPVIFIGFLFLFALGPGSLFKALSFKNRASLWEMSGKVLMIYGGSIPLIGAAFHGYDLIYVFRDIVAFFFLCLPLFIVNLIRQSERKEQIFLWALLAIGICFALRTLGPAYGFFPEPAELLYLANSPLVLFSAILFLGYAGIYSGQNIAPQNIFISLILMMFFLISFTALLVDVQRGPVLAIILSVVTWLSLGLLYRPAKTIRLSFILMLIVVLSLPVLSNILDMIALKTTQVGLNMRLQEAQAAFEATSQSLATMLFGLGWGAGFYSPAVGGLEVTFTHSLLSYIYLKTGFIGLVLTVLYLCSFLFMIAEIFVRSPVKGMALFWPFSIPILFYASHKSLDYGLLLTLIVIWFYALGCQKNNCVREHA